MSSLGSGSSSSPLGRTVKREDILACPQPGFARVAPSSKISPQFPWPLPPLRQIATACLRWLGNGVFTPSRGAWIWWKMWLMKANEFALDNKDSPPRFGGQRMEPVESAAAMGIGQIDSHQGRDNPRYSIVFRPGAAGSLFPRRPRSKSAIHRASALSHSGGCVSDAG